MNTGKKIIPELMTSSVSRIQIVLCSSSFRLGFKMAGVKFVVHYGARSFVEDYVEEVGWTAKELALTGYIYAKRTIGIALSGNIDSLEPNNRYHNTATSMQTAGILPSKLIANLLTSLSMLTFSLTQC